MKHVLDNPAWNALISGNSKLSNGNDHVKYFAKEVSPFVGLEENSAYNFQVLHELIPHDDPIGFINPEEMEVPLGWNLVQCIKTFQMVCEDPSPLTLTELEVIPLTDQHVPEMLALTELTNPGPFASRTIEFGHYQGIFDKGKLVAMAGQRLHPFEFAEISAVCTHPDYLGKGYAKRLLLNQIHRIKWVSGIPLLHVRDDNERAIKVYKDLGFVVRKEIYFYIIRKD